MSASNQTYTVCCGSPGNGMPHGWRCREIEMSCRPASSRRSTSLRRISGCTVSEPERMRSSTASRRSEEHTSELQSRFDLVCRLLLEKKKQKNAKGLRVILALRHEQDVAYRGRSLRRRDPGQTREVEDASPPLGVRQQPLHHPRQYPQ